MQKMEQEQSRRGFGAFNSIYDVCICMSIFLFKFTKFQGNNQLDEKEIKGKTSVFKKFLKVLTFGLSGSLHNNIVDKNSQESVMFRRCRRTRLHGNLVSFGVSPPLSGNTAHISHILCQGTSTSAISLLSLI